LLDGPRKSATPQVIYEPNEADRAQAGKLQEMNPDSDLNHRRPVKRREIIK
jgi:hypothetical protein